MSMASSRPMESTTSRLTSAPVVTWFAIRLMITFGIVFGWTLKQIDFIMAYPQAPIECDLYMDLHHSISVKGADLRNYDFKLLVNSYGQKQGGRVWNEYLTAKLVDELGFTQSLIDQCVFYRGTTIFICYTDGDIALDINGNNIDSFVQELQNKANLKVDDTGHPNDYVGVNIQHQLDGTFHFLQTCLIDSIIADCGLANSSKKKQVPAKSSKILFAHLDLPPFDSPYCIYGDGDLVSGDGDIVSED